MNMILGIILFILMIVIGGKRGLKSFISLCLNFLLLIFTFYLIACGFNSIIVTLLGCLVFSYFILFYVNGKNIKTRISFLSVIVVLVLLTFFISLITYISRISGFGEESFEEINMFSYSININMSNITVCLILISLIGAIIDASIAISSALYEVHENNYNLSSRELFLSGMNIGKSILGTTTNTLLFAYFAEFMTLIIWFYVLDNSVEYIINSKVFASEIIKILLVNIGSILVIPVTAFLTSRRLKR